MPARLACITLLAATAATAGNYPLLTPTQERFDWDFGSSRGLCVIEQDLFCDGLIYDTTDLNQKPVDVDYVSEGANGMAYDEVSGQRWIGFPGGFLDHKEGNNISNPISAVQAMAAYDNYQFFLNDGRLGSNHHYDLAIRNGRDGDVTIYPDAFENTVDSGFVDIVSGMSVETGPDGRQILIASSGNQIFQFHLSPDWRSNASFRLLSVHNLGGNLAFGIHGLDYSNGFIYVCTLAGIGEYPYQLLPANATCPQDLNNDLALNFLDVSEFLSAYMNQDPAADFTEDSNFNFQDISTFIQQFAAGCP